jgi:hypothetical protein
VTAKSHNESWSQLCRSFLRLMKVYNCGRERVPLPLGSQGDTSTSSRTQERSRGRKGWDRNAFGRRSVAEEFSRVKTRFFFLSSFLSLLLVQKRMHCQQLLRSKSSWLLFSVTQHAKKKTTRSADGEGKRIEQRRLLFGTHKPQTRTARLGSVGSESWPSFPVCLGRYSL